MAKKKRSARKKPQPKRATNPKARSKPKRATSGFPHEIQARVPEALRLELDKLTSKFEGRYAYGLHYRSPSQTFPVSFDPTSAYDVMTTYGDALPRTESLLPLATIGSEHDICFALDPSSPEWPVFFFEHEAGYHPFAPSLDAFLRQLLGKGEKTPFAALEALVAKADALDEKKQYDKVIALLRPVLDKTPRARALGEPLTRALILAGRAYRNTKQLDEAIAMYRDGISLGDDFCALNLCNLYFVDLEDFVEAAEVARPLHMRGEAIGTLAWFWLKNYTGQLALLTGDMAGAYRAYHELRTRFVIDEPKHIVNASAALEELAARVTTVATAARAILKWFAAPAMVARVPALRAWADQLTDDVRSELLLGEKPTDSELLATTTQRYLRIDSDTIRDLGFLAPFVMLRKLRLDTCGISDFATLPELHTVTRVSVKQVPLKSLAGIDRFPNLVELELIRTKLATLDGIEVLSRLTSLTLKRSAVEDLQALASLTSLEQLDLAGTPVADLSPLARCTRLRSLVCRETESVNTGLAALATLPALASVDLRGTSVSPDEVKAFCAARPDVVVYSDTSDEEGTSGDHRALWKSLDAHPELRDAIKKECIDADEPIDEQLAKVAGADHLSLSEANIRSLAPLARMKRLRFLDIEVNPLDDLAPLSGLGTLDIIRAGYTHVTDLRPLRALTRLSELRVRGTRVRSLEGLEGAVALADLNLDETAVSSLEPLRALRNLAELSFNTTAVASLAPLSGHPRLTVLDCANTKVTDLGPLATCASLIRIDCYNLRGLTGLMRLTGLRRLAVVASHGALDASELAEFRKARPDVEVD